MLAGRMLVECADLTQVAPRNRDKLERVREWQCAIVRQNTLPATERVLAGRTLAVLGDPRPEVTSLDGMHFCFVPPGLFAMGSREDDPASEDERPQHTVDLAYPYFIARFPVTVAQWREYVQAIGKAAEHRDSLRGRINDPAIYVSWHEALRFCDFLSQAWQALLPEGWVVPCPRKQSGKKRRAAATACPPSAIGLKKDQLIEKLKATPTGTQMPNPYRERAYPWGDRFDADLANVESTVGETSAVGCYTTGLSPYGCEEMSGNVWEWTRSLWGKGFFEPDFKYPYEPLDGKREDLNAGNDMWRVVRGGSWGYNRYDARCAYRGRIRPDARNVYIGFRVVLRSAPVP